MNKPLLFFTMLLCLFSFNNAKAQVWESVGPAGGISTGSGGRMTLLNDKQNNLILGYYDIPATKGSVQKFDGSSWSYLGDSPGITTANTSAYNSTSVDSNGVVYFTSQAGTSGMEVRKFENNTWTQLPNVTNNVINFNTSLVSPDNVLFAANSEASGTVKKYVNGTWQQVGAAGFAGGVPFYLDMVIGTNGKVYVSYNSNGSLHVYENDVNATSTSAWQPVGGIANLAPSPSAEEYNSSLALDSNNNLFVAYVSTSAGGNKLNVKKFNGTSWSQLGTENFSPFRAKYNSIAIGSNDIVYVATSKWEDADMLRNYVLGYNETTNSWTQTGTGFASTGQGVMNSLSVDSLGNLFLSYSDLGLGKVAVKKLNLAIVAPTSIEVSTVDNVAPAITVDKGTLQLSAVVNPSNANQNIVWSVSEGSTFATVSETGLVTAIASNAVVKIKATSALNFAVFDEIAVTITNQNSPVAASSVKISTVNDLRPEINSIGGNLQLLSKTLPVEADQYVNWTVAQNGNVASVDSNGKVTGLAEGFAIIRATDTKSNLYDEIRVDVFKNGCSQGNPTTLGLGFDITKNSRVGADDFVVAEGTRFEMSKVKLIIIKKLNSQMPKFDMRFLEVKGNGQPGKVITAVNNITPTSMKFLNDFGSGLGEYELDLYFPQPVVFNEGSYYMNPVATSQDGSQVFWNVTTEGTIGNVYYQDRLDGNGFLSTGFNASFTVVGNCTPMPFIVRPIQGQDSQILIGQTVQLQATTNGAVFNDVNWTIDNGNDLISISSTGLVTGLASGVAKVRATDPATGNFATFNVYVSDPNACGKEVPSNNKEQGYSFSTSLAVDIDVPTGTLFTISSVLPTTVGFATTFSYTFYKDENGKPGQEITTVGGQIVEDTSGTQWEGLPYFDHKYEVKLSQEVKLEAGKYWMTMTSDAAGWESTTLGVIGEPAMIFNQGDWVATPSGSDFVYELKGTCKASELGTSEVSNMDFKFYPNPVIDVLNFDSTKKVESIEIFGMSGQKVKQLKPNMTNGKVSTDKLPTGVYIFKASLEDGTTRSFRVIKK